MKKLLMTMILMLTVGAGISQAQKAVDSWAVGAGFTYPRYNSVNITAADANYGGYLSIQRNFSEHVGLRLKLAFSHLEGSYTNEVSDLITEQTNLITGGLDMLYYLLPCEAVSPYLFAGMGANYKMFTNAQTVIPDADKIGAQVNLGAGFDFEVNRDFSISTEFGYHLTANSALDGAIVPEELNARDSYFTVSLGVNYLFGKGALSDKCDYNEAQPIQAAQGQNQGMTKSQKDRMAYNSMVVDRYIQEIADDKLVLVGVTFGFDESSLTSESYPVLDKMVKLLEKRPAMKIEIAGFTDYIGTADYNLDLAEARANTVKDYLVSKGVAASRLSIVSYGQGKAGGDNMTTVGRDTNRKIVFRIIK